ncbi:dihydrodipicolinate reductase [Isosphaera pallida ATCC 43644]|jgi:4-hydroxy-tetrahydrodipicolinate reductase|uniref:4-hydroxy-tetrahydrodipicolinate reductase n=1 Tax=Isosphaera pallida (strain ATCC 43644 / DSM 9630 / IS1B) TaxID=575540 RepID=E8R5T5_ISOPI|nr:4-hydroxy-tetrahydrodipicolinate reductase [Isosphaera pallida]ADV62842.1 dihydrodipicolinate reductase [Isosphaera pallida ATCC 43644]
MTTLSTVAKAVGRIARPRRVAIHGAAGRMGQRLIALLDEFPDLTLAAALEHPNHPLLGHPVAGTTYNDRWPDQPLDGGEGRAVEVVIDFSRPEALVELAETCAQRGAALVVGTTGLDATHREALDRAARVIPVLVSPNMNRAVNVLMRLAAEAARLLRGDVDIEILERHHRHKADAPSGTALKLGEIVAEAAGLSSVIHGRHGQVGARPRSELAIHAIRCGDNPGEHTIVFGMEGDVIELTHRASNRDGFARGALEAARFLVGKPPGHYAMSDVLGITS